MTYVLAGRRRCIVDSVDLFGHGRTRCGRELTTSDDYLPPPTLPVCKTCEAA